MAQPNLTIALSQINPLMGDVVGNVLKIREEYYEADGRGVDLAVFPELCLTGSPLEGLADDGDLPGVVEEGLQVLRAATKGRRAALVVGAPQRDADRFFSAALVFEDGEVSGCFRKRGLPGDGAVETVLDSTRNPMKARVTRIFEFFDKQARDAADEAEASIADADPIRNHGDMVVVVIGRDIWRPDTAARFKAAGAELLVSINACPFRPRILQTRIRDITALRVSETGLPLVYVNAVGGQDTTVFDGGSFVLDSQGRCLVQMPQWEECATDCELARPFAAGNELFPAPEEEIYRSLVLALGDYVRKSGFSDVVIGMSGGMDSAMVAALAGDALGPRHVHCVRLPSEFTSDLSNSAAADMCEKWGFSMATVSIGGLIATATDALVPATPNGLRKLTRENMQARARGFLLMTLSNEHNWLLLATGNKSEIAMGYATLYGDMCGGYTPLKDIFKTTVYSLARWRNGNRPDGLKGPEGVVIPTEIIDRPPSAELAPGQLDTDSLPPYPILDAILSELLEHDTPVSLVPSKGFEPELVDTVFRMLKSAEYKRRQGAPGPIITDKGFRRVPVVNRFDPSQRERLREMADGK
ncbi:MAG: NAD+ synthase [Planctomycetaceae bacterium]|nr:NAD+ synthase [Planctomycetaceae bacterium]